MMAHCPADLTLIHEPDDRLHQVCRPVTEFGPELTSFAKAMQQVMLRGNAFHRGVGLAASQVGVSVRVICVEAGGATVMVNPVFEPARHAGQYETSEGCLSCSGMYLVTRWHAGTVSYLTPHNVMKTQSVTGFRAQVVQHELDHLDGKTLESQVAKGVTRRAESRPA